MTTTTHATYVITNEGTILVQLPDDNRWGFYLSEEDSSWPGGFGIATSWEPIEDTDPRITSEDHESLDWILNEHRAFPVTTTNRGHQS